MFPFKKKKEDEIPDLPPLPELPPLPNLSSQLPKKSKERLPQLPTFPSTKTGDDVSRQAVRRAIKEPEEIEPEELESPEGYEESLPTYPMTREIEPSMTQEMSVKIKPVMKVTKEIRPSIKMEPVYIRIDKYQDSLLKFQEIKRKIMEMENLLKETRELKSKEETQLVEWEREIQEAKNKLDNIDKTIFKKLED
jgi:hypothetical protein